MALDEKEVFYALLHNHHFTLKSLCVKSCLSYHGLVKRLKRGTLLTLTPIEAEQFCQTLNVDYEDFTELIYKAKNGEFPDDYPKEDIKLKVSERKYFEDRTVVMLLTPEEAKMIEMSRLSSEKAVQKALDDKG